MKPKFLYFIISVTLLSALLMGCSKSKETSSYTSEEIEYDKQVKTAINNLHTHFSNFDSLSKSAKPPYNDPLLIGKLEDELDLAVQVVQDVNELNCPSSRFENICSDLNNMKDAIIKLRNNIGKYYSSNFGKSERQSVIDAMNAFTSISQSIADDYKELETKHGTIK